MYVCMYVCMDGWMDEWMDGCMHVYICMCVSKYVCVCVWADWADEYETGCACEWASVHLLVCVCVYVCECVWCVCAYVRGCICDCCVAVLICVLRGIYERMWHVMCKCASRCVCVDCLMFKRVLLFYRTLLPTGNFLSTLLCKLQCFDGNVGSLYSNQYKLYEFLVW